MTLSRSLDSLTESAFELLDEAFDTHGLAASRLSQAVLDVWTEAA